MEEEKKPPGPDGHSQVRAEAQREECACREFQEWGREEKRKALRAEREAGERLLTTRLPSPL